MTLARRALIRRSLLTATATAALGFSAMALAWSSHERGEAVKGDGQIKREARSVESFDAISLAGSFEIKVKQSTTQRLELEADGNLLPYVETKVVEGSKGRTLQVQVKRGYALASKQPLRIEVDMATLRALSLAGSGKAEVLAMKSDKLVFSIAGTGSVKGQQLEIGSLKMDVAGNGQIEAAGRTNELAVSIAGRGDVRAAELAGDDVKVSIAGSGDAEVQANKKLKISIAGSGDVRYRGTAEVSQSVAGSGSISRL
ncbi:hypothetical protein HNQ51_003579 [Inhella inkyongensis]|uniref:Putative auto-transporter adhesin head GIN domain-containing protein n=1 Tax=Inhella inkyongensis TaxID=392593 RepID=A0A840SBU1_9BURK|nr:head GIN domain-containing protein [Inhella inkyongensis]MBB5206234.1 hypothetical protein [Inhella inkyongensis]